MRTRSRMSPLSDNTARSGSAPLRYRPSTGESAKSAAESMKDMPRTGGLNWPRMISQGESNPGRKEHDSFGDIEVAAGASWGAQTERARRNFAAIGGGPMPPDFITAVALIKAAAARANARLGLLAGGCRQRDRRRGERHRRIAPPRPVPRRCVPDGQWHQHQHERQRGDRSPREPVARQARAPERSRQHVPEQQ